MSAASLLSMKEKTSDCKTDGFNHEGHDDDAGFGAVSGGGGGAGGDPAVLAVGPARRALVYSVRELMRMRDSPLVRKDLDTAFAGNDRLVLVLKRRTESPNEDDRGARGDAPNENQNHKGVYGRDRDRERRSADPRERVRKESETSGGIVLSPQRRSFTSGCGAPASGTAPPPHVARTRPESPLAAQTPKPDPGGRRIGSGRIMVRDTNATWEEPEWTGAEPYRPPRERERDSRTNQDRYERRSYGRDRDSYTSEMKRERDDRFNNEKNRDSRDNRDVRDNRDRDDYRRSGGRNRRYDKDEEPEWFSGGPTSQHDTIELRGFDEPNTKPDKDTKDQEKRSGGSKSPERWRSEPATAAATATATSPQPPPSDNNTSNDTESTAEVQPDESAGPAGGMGPAGGVGLAVGMGGDAEFNLDDFLKMDTIPDVLTNGNSDMEGGSRFSRWFRRESPTAAHFEPLLQSIVDDLDCRMEPPPAPLPPSEPHHVFAPISPAPAPSLLDLLRRANANADVTSHRDVTNVSGGKIHSLEELEARLRPQPQPPTPDQDMSAFKRLLAQVSGGHAVPGAHQPQAPPQQQPQPQPMSLLQMLSKSMEAQQQQPPAQQQQPPAQQPPHIPQQLLYKLLHVQQRQQQQQAQQAQAQQQARPPMGPMGPTAADRELLQRPEAQAIIHGLKAGEITVQHLMQQLGNPGLQSRHREVLLTILRLHQQQQQQQRQMGGGSPVPPAHLVVPPHHQQPLTLSPLPHTAVPNRIPSPRELVAHTQCIMQSALIKKKLEEQRENYRRRHELPKQPTPISFTPTSVLRKMTAEKESESLSPKQQWAQPLKMPQGRPIVKGNHAGAAPMGYGPQSEYQQYLAQQQQLSTGRPYQQPARQQVQYTNMARGMASGTTLHQLLVQSHQRSLNELGGGSAGGGDNQLARWFSPELLARASAGKLPSVHVPNAMSLEELERHHSPAPPVRN